MYIDTGDRMEPDMNPDGNDLSRIREILIDVIDEVSDADLPELVDKLEIAIRIVEKRPDPAYLPFKRFACPSFHPPSFASFS